MAKNKNSISKLVSQLTTTNVEGIDVSKALKPTSLSASSFSNSASLLKPPPLGDVRALAIGGKETAVGINFGRASNSRTATAKSSNTWTNLLTQSASGGAANGLTGVLSGIAGIGGLFSGIASLFGGGKSTPPPLVDFRLPNSTSLTLYSSSKGTTVYQGTATEKPNTSAASVNQPISAQQLQYQSAAIAQAVKTAMLNSSSLNDVIAEI